MTLEDRLGAFEKLGNHLTAIDAEEWDQLFDKIKNENPWFTDASVRLAVKGLSNYLDRKKLEQWIGRYHLTQNAAKKIALVMPGNIPLAGFHDFLTVLISGHAVLVKLSSKDSVLLTFIAEKLKEIEPRFAPLITIAERLKNFDAVIATGSDNSARYFHYYFGKYPHIIRKNRSSCAVLTGDETSSEIDLLGKDVFTYFGLGCRNVSKIFFPKDYDPVRLIEGWKMYENIIHQHKYNNNYDYQKSILLVNKKPFYDSGYVLLQESERLVSPISVVYYERYENTGDLSEKLQLASSKIQCIVGKSNPIFVPFGQAQFPQLWDYADNVDTLQFLENIH
ncbi:MAG: acyl-CoA reductase [Cyclobacteriaceae bacterium]